LQIVVNETVYRIACENKGFTCDLRAVAPTRSGRSAAAG